MTYPQYGQPQAYPMPAPSPYGPPAPGYPPAPPYPPVSQPAGQPYGVPAGPAPFQMPTFVNPTAGGDGLPAPAMRALEGRVVAFNPTAHDPNAKMGNDIKPSVDATIIVSSIGDNGEDLGPLTYGDRLQASPAGPPRPVVARVSQFPAEFTIRNSNDQVVRSLIPLIPSGGWMLAKVVRGTQGTKGNPPFLLEPVPDHHPARAQLADGFQQRHASPTALKRTPEPLNGGWEVPGPGQQPAAPAGYPQAAPPPPGLPPQVNYGSAPMAAPPPPQNTQTPPPGARQGADGGWYVAPPGWPDQAWMQIPNPEAYGTRIG
jgi:hypothetical protein